MSEQTITTDKVVTIHFVLSDEDGETIDASTGADPLTYLHGHQNIVPGLEKELDGKKVGEKLTAVVPPDQGYGERSGAGPQPVERESFPDDAEVSVGDQFAVEDQQGQLIPVWVTKVEPSTVWIDRDHPLAGATLRFEVEVVDVRDAEKEELEHGHAHVGDQPHG